MMEALPLDTVDDPAGAWWQAWRGDGDVRARARLVEHYQRFARILAAKLYGQHQYRVLEFDDYFQYANVGLIEALERFEPDGGARFETFAASRIRGAILDGIRRSSDVQEQISARRRIAAERVGSLAAGGGAADTESLFAHLAEVAVGLAVGFALDGTGMYQAAEDAGGDGAYQAVELAQMAQRIRALVRALPDAQREVVAGHYLQQLSFTEVAARMQLSRGRVAQLHKEALGGLRHRLQGQGVISFSC